MAELANIKKTRLYFRENDANACEAQEGKSTSSIYSHLSCVAVAHSVPNARHAAGVVRPANAVYATTLKLGIIRRPLGDCAPHTKTP